MIRAFLLCLALLGTSAWAEGRDETFIAPDRTSGVKKLLHRAGFADIQKSYALVIGVHEFSDFEDLPTEDDALNVYDYLVNEAGFDYVHLLTGDKVTKDRVSELMQDVFANEVKTSDRFLFYWSGHGHTIDARGFLPVKTSRKNKRFSMISMDNIRQWDSYIKAHHVLYLMDACYSGLAGGAPQSDLAEITRAQLSGPSRHLITAGRGDEQTIAIDALGGSIFTHALLKGLRGGADYGNERGKDQLITVGELRRYLGEEITELREFYGWERTITPQIRDLRGSDGAFFFPIPAAFPEDAPPPPPKPKPNAPIADLQAALTDLGYDPGPVTGEMSFKTQAALFAFQESAGLAPTGTTNAETTRALLVALSALVRPQGSGAAGPDPQDSTDEATFAAQGPTAPTQSKHPVARRFRWTDPSLPPPTLKDIKNSAKKSSERAIPPVRVSGFNDCRECPTLVRVKGRETERENNGLTVTSKRLNDFYIATTETTVAQFTHYLQATNATQDPYSERNCYAWTNTDKMRRNDTKTFTQTGEIAGQFPAACVSRKDAERYIAWLNEQSPGAGYRLPTEDEYQFLLERQYADFQQSKPVKDAFASIDQTDRLALASFHVEVLCGYGNFADASAQFSWRNMACNDPYPAQASVQNFPPDANGIYDLAGNLWEWAAECWRGNPTQAATYTNCDRGTVRGGSFDDPVRNATPEARQPVNASLRQTNIGFRVAHDAD